MKDNFLKRFISRYVCSGLTSVSVDNVGHPFGFSSKLDEYYDHGISTENYPNSPNSWDQKKDTGNTKREFRPRVDDFHKQRSKPEDTMPSHKKPEHPEKDATAASIYKVSLPVPSNEKERQSLYDYKEKVKKSGWVLTPIRANSDSLAYVLTPKGSELEAAAYIAASLLEEALGRAS